VSNSGAQLRPLAPQEQDALVRSALRAADLVIAPVPDARVEADLTRQLGLLHSLHGVTLRAVTVEESLPEITVIVDADPAVPGSYLLDMPRLRVRQPFQSATHADLVVRLRDRPGQELHGRLENAPHQVVSVDPLAPPAWLN
ncbi:MAG: hypothetical protein JO287_07335, partial [Pseudonocardiales bacterium]|nr:hypothetical protein [Pseudonocardiales bacterium]